MTKEKVVIKVGTDSLLAEKEKPSVVFEKLAREIVSLSENYSIVLVTSGAIGFAAKKLGLNKRPVEIEHLQALSCIGQVALMQHWQQAFGRYVVGQVLITNRELQDKVEEKRLKSSLEAMWAIGALPIINENDALADEQIRIGDNDTLSARLATHIGAQKLILLSNIDGLYRDFGTKNSELLSVVDVGDANRYINNLKTTFGTGGIATKIQAAEIACEYNIATYLANAKEDNVLKRVLSGDIGTRFVVK